MTVEDTLAEAHRAACKAGGLLVHMLIKRRLSKASLGAAIKLLETSIKLLKTIGEPGNV